MIYYPHYTPSKHHLRSILLFSDQINLIVPSVDQHGVQERQNISDILSKRPNLIEFKDPQYRYDDWVNKPGIDFVIQNLLTETSAQMLKAGVHLPKTDNQGNLHNRDDHLINTLSSKYGWKHVAAEKFPHKIHSAIFESNCAVRVGLYVDNKTGKVIEHNGVLCHPILADFILCRMAREASFVEASPSITFGGTDYMNHLLDGEQLNNSPEQALLQSSIDLFVPDNLQSLSSEDFFAIRNDYSNIRKIVWSYLNSKVVTNNLNMNRADGKALLARLIQTRDKIEIEMAEVAKSIGYRRFISKTAFGLEALASIGGAAAGAVISDTTGGAILGASIGFGGGKFAHKLSTLGHTNGQLNSVVMTKAKVERMGLRKRWDAPNYWVK